LDFLIFFNFLNTTSVVGVDMKIAMIAGILVSCQLSAYEMVDFSEVEGIESLAEDVVIRCEEGAYIPLGFFMTGDVFSLEGESSLSLKAKQTFYLKGNFLEGEFLFSKNLDTWEEWDQFFTGSLGVCKKRQKEVMGMSIDFELNKR
jgi:hypothetical protein